MIIILSHKTSVVKKHFIISLHLNSLSMFVMLIISTKLYDRLVHFIRVYLHRLPDRH
jgi:hypothetical protein